MWERFKLKQRIVGTGVDGDKSSPKTRWWNKWFLKKFVWKRVAVFRVNTVGEGYYLCYKPTKGVTHKYSQLLSDTQFRVQIGYEDVTFFILTPEGDERIIDLLCTEDKNLGKHKDSPLY